MCKDYWIQNALEALFEWGVHAIYELTPSDFDDKIMIYEAGSMSRPHE